MNVLCTQYTFFFYNWRKDKEPLAIYAYIRSSDDIYNIFTFVDHTYCAKRAHYILAYSTIFSVLLSLQMDGEYVSNARLQCA